LTKGKTSPYYLLEVENIKAKIKNTIIGLTIFTILIYLFLQEEIGNKFLSSTASGEANMPGVILASTGLFIVICLVRQN